MNKAVVLNKFNALFGGNPIVIKSPGRINLIGEHTDYNMGFVMPAATDKAIYIAIAKNDLGKIRLHAINLEDTIEVDALNFEKSATSWANYLLGAVNQLQKSNAIQGFDCVFGGDIPLGAGMSSSSALTCGAAFSLNKLFDLSLSKRDLVELCHSVEVEYIGVNGGIMDQFAIIFGKENQVIKLDCWSLEVEYYQAHLNNHEFVLFDTQVSHNLVATEYNQRRAECDEGVETIAWQYPEVKSLRDCSLEMLRNCKGNLNDIVYKRCEYVILENQRVLDAAKDFQNNDLEAFGQKMFASHNGLKNKYDVSCPELDFLVECVKNNQLVLGARMMGGGFGGCTINLVVSNNIESLITSVQKAYKEKFNIDLKAYRANISQGIHII